TQPLDQGDRLGPAGGLPDHLEVVRGGERGGDAVAHDGVVVDDDDPDHAAVLSSAGSRTDTAVPPPGSVSIASSPASRSARCRIPRSPNEVAGRGAASSKPRPSSRTSSTTSSSS